MNGSLRSNDLVINEKNVPDLNIQTKLYNGILAFSAKQGSNLLNSSIQIRENRLTGSVRAMIPHLSSFSYLTGISDLSGELYMNGNVSGTMQYPELNFTLKGLGLSMHQFPADSLYLKGKLRKQLFEIYESYVQGTGKLSSEDLLLKFSSHTSGNFKYSGSLRGFSDQFNGYFDVSLSSPGYQSIQIDTASLHADLIGDSLVFRSGIIKKDSLDISLTGKYHIKENRGTVEIGTKIIKKSEKDNLPFKRYGDVDIRVNGNGFHAWNGSFRFDKIDLRLVSILTSNQVQLEGSLNSSADWRLSHKFSLDNGTLNINRGFLQTSKQHEPVRQLNLSASVNSGTLSIDTLYGEIHKIPFALSGKTRIFDHTDISTRGVFYIANQPSILLQSSGNFDNIKGYIQLEKFDLSLLESTTSRITNISGIAQGVVSFSGSVQSPDMEGKLSIQHFSFHPEG